MEKKLAPKSLPDVNNNFYQKFARWKQPFLPKFCQMLTGFFYQKFIFKDVGGEGDGRNADLVFAEAEDSNRVESIHVPQPGNLSLFSHELL